MHKLGQYLSCTACLLSSSYPLSSCKADASCKCNGWKNPNPPANPPRPDAPTPTSTPSDPCRTCSHPLSSHVSHLDSVKEEELDRLLGIVVDVENLFMCVHKEEDSDTKQVGPPGP